MKNSLTIPILNNEHYVAIVFGDDIKLQKVLRQWSYPDDLDRVGTLIGKRGRCFHAEGCHPVIAMPIRPKTPTEIATLAHEACHAIEYIFASIGQPLGTEVFAHSVGAVVRETLQAIKDKRI